MEKGARQKRDSPAVTNVGFYGAKTLKLVGRRQNEVLHCFCEVSLLMGQNSDICCLYVQRDVSSGLIRSL